MHRVASCSCDSGLLNTCRSVRSGPLQTAGEGSLSAPLDSKLPANWKTELQRRTGLEAFSLAYQFYICKMGLFVFKVAVPPHPPLPVV